MKIYPTDFIDIDKEEIGIESMSIRYCQPLDCAQEGDRECDVQTITITAVASDGCVTSKNIEEGKEEDGFFLTISTDRWAINDINELSLLINDFKLKLHTQITDKK